MNTLRFAKTRLVKSPQRGTAGSAGIDFFIPDSFEDVKLAPGERINIPSGIKVDVPEGFALIAFNKSGVAHKKGLIVGACVVDSDYQGEIHISLINTSLVEYQSLQAGDKIVQFLLMPVVHCGLEQVYTGWLFDEVTDRGAKGFGSTGSK